MRTVGLTVGLVALVLGVGSVAHADDMFRWRDEGGTLHFSNVPAAGSEAMGMDAEEPGNGATASAREPGTGEPMTDTAPVAGEADSAFSTSASLRRQQLERDLRDTKRRLQALDGQIGALARVRMQNAAGSAATGGVRANATEARADEEKSLTTEQEQLKAHETEVRGAYNQLRDEVTTRLGGVPDWWIEVR
jgi:hypothetical protein